MHEIQYYSTENGRSPVREFVNALNLHIRKKYFGRAEHLLQTFGSGMPSPHVDNLGDGLWEFKVSFANLHFRFIFLTEKNCLIFLHGFQKKTNQISHHEIEIAKQRKADFYRQLKAGLIEL